jgi:hypothetical protein
VSFFRFQNHRGKDEYNKRRVSKDRARESIGVIPPENQSQENGI